MQQAAGGDCEPLQLPPDPLADGGPSQLVISGDLAPEADPDTGHPGADIAAPPPSRTPPRMNTQSPADLSHARLEALLHELQRRAFDVYEDAALRAEANPPQAELPYAPADADTAPLSSEERRVGNEGVMTAKSR